MSDVGRKKQREVDMGKLPKQVQSRNSDDTCGITAGTVNRHASTPPWRIIVCRFAAKPVTMTW